MQRAAIGLQADFYLGAVSWALLTLVGFCSGPKREYGPRIACTDASKLAMTHLGILSMGVGVRHKAQINMRCRVWSEIALVGLPGIAALGAFSVWHLLRTGFWYDESMQFWISLGLDGFAPPYSMPGSFRDVIRQNAAANLDPGGFSIILALWLKLGTSEIWQRTLPLLFFVVGLACFGWLGWTLRRSIPFAVLSSLAPTAYPLILDYATEVRAYSMEFAGIILGCILLDRLSLRSSILSAFLAGSVFGVFLGSRYSFGIFTAAAILALAHQTLGNRSGSATLAVARLSAFVAPIILSAALIFFMALLPQYKGRMSYNGGELVQYLANATATGKSLELIVAMLAKNLFGPAGLPLTFAGLIGLAGLTSHRWSERVGIYRMPPTARLFGMLAFAALCLTALVWRWHPWDMSQKWSLWLHALSAVAVVRFAAGLLELAGPPAASGWEREAPLAAFMLIGTMVLDLRFSIYRRPDSSLVPALKYLENAAPAAGSVAVAPHWYPTVRYFYEYGSLARSRIYPVSFSLPDQTSFKPLVSSQTQYLVTTRPLAEARAEFPQVKITQDPASPEYLFRAEMPSPRAAPSDD